MKRVGFLVVRKKNILVLLTWAMTAAVVVAMAFVATCPLVVVVGVVVVSAVLIRTLGGLGFDRDHSKMMVHQTWSIAVAA